MTLTRWFGYRLQFGASLLLAAGLFPSLSTPASAQYIVTSLASNQMAIGANPADPDLINPWGITATGSSPFWLSDNGTGKSTLYIGAAKQGLVVTIPSAAPHTAQGTPTGTIANTTTSSFVVTENNKSGKALFLFATLDGTISGWSPMVDQFKALMGTDQSTRGASYTALAEFTTTTGDFLYAANDTMGGGIDMFDASFNYLETFTDPVIPRDYAPYGIRVINGQLWVTYNSTKKANGGFVDVFQINNDGSLTKLFEANGPLHQPWGLALAPANFGQYSNAVLIGDNINRGRINAFNPTNGQFLGTLTDVSGQPITIDQLWGLDFGNGSDGPTGALFFTAGPDNYANGLYGTITVAQ